MPNRRQILGALAGGALFQAAGRGQENKVPTGYTDTPLLPGSHYRVHDDARPRPRVMTPGTCSTAEQPGKPPSDAIVLFDGKDLSQWAEQRRGETAAPTWKIENGYVEITRDSGHLVTKQGFGDVQLHIEWASPAEIVSNSQGRGNSGVILMSRYEIQVLDSYDNPTYADGQAAAIYGQYPPLVNASRKPGEWQAYDIVFEAPRFMHGKLVKPAYATVLHNGVLAHHRQEFMGSMKHRTTTEYQPHGPEEPLMLQYHSNPVRYRNIWVRKLDLEENKR